MSYAKNPIIVEAVYNILKQLGDDPERDGLIKTPERVARAYDEWFSGYHKTIKDINVSTFETDYTGMITETGIRLYSTCEHHLAPIIGFVHIGYIPGEGKRAVGLSKLVRIVELHSRRLQIQEQLTQQIAEDIRYILKPLGVGVQITAMHMCMSSRGVRDQDNRTTTTVLLGNFDQPHVKEEFFNTIRDNANRLTL